MPLVEQLKVEYYETIERLCAIAKKQVDRVERLETGNAASQYILVCNNLITETAQHIKNIKEKYLPYIEELSGKVTNKHDCSHCSGGCKLNHDMQLIELKASNNTMKNMNSRLQMASLPLYTETMYPDEYRLLRSQMTLIEINLTELILLENDVLFPKIRAAQRIINAGNS